MRTFAHLFTDGRRCEAPRCRVDTFFLWPTPEGFVYRACCPAHFEEARQASAENERTLGR